MFGLESIFLLLKNQRESKPSQFHSSSTIPLYLPSVLPTDHINSPSFSLFDSVESSSPLVQSSSTFSSSSKQSSSTSSVPNMEEKPSLRTVNEHHMLTRSKDGIFKPKVFYDYFSISHEPQTVWEAQQSPYWVKAMNSEYEALMKNHTWSLVPLPSHMPIIGCKCVYKLKMNPDGTVARHKARLVDKGYSQTPGLDYSENFSPVVKPTTICIVLTLAL